LGFRLALRGTRQRTGEPLVISLVVIDEKEGSTVVVPIITTASCVRVKNATKVYLHLPRKVTVTSPVREGEIVEQGPDERQV
jgi:hypothetical protein